MKNVSRQYKPNLNDSNLAKELAKLDKSPEAIKLFYEKQLGLSNYGYWFMLSTLWINYSGYSDLEMWKELFSSGRDLRKSCIMKPDEVEEYDKLPYDITVYRAHREGEKDWISYTTDMITAGRFAFERNVPTISEYKIKKCDVIAYFLRRGEKEIIMLKPSRAEFVREILVSDEGDHAEFYGVV